MTLDREELAYAGGLFEGEGTIYVRNLTPPKAWICLAMSDREPIERFQAAVGGFGKIYGPYQKKKKLTRNGNLPKPMYVYHLYDFEKVQAVVAMLWPWLGPRRRGQAATVLTRITAWSEPEAA